MPLPSHPQVSSLESALAQASSVTVSMTAQVAQTLADANAQVGIARGQHVEECSPSETVGAVVQTGADASVCRWAFGGVSHRVSHRVYLLAWSHGTHWCFGLHIPIGRPRNTLVPPSRSPAHYRPGRPARTTASLPLSVMPTSHAMFNIIIAFRSFLPTPPRSTCSSRVCHPASSRRRRGHGGRRRLGRRCVGHGNRSLLVHSTCRHRRYDAVSMGVPACVQLVPRLAFGYTGCPPQVTTPMAVTDLSSV